MDLYQELYKDMTQGTLSKINAMSAGTLGLHKAERNKLARNIALGITKKYEQNLMEDKIKEIIQGLRLKLREFNSRKETE